MGTSQKATGIFINVIGYLVSIDYHNFLSPCKSNDLISNSQIFLQYSAIYYRIIGVAVPFPHGLPLKKALQDPIVKERLGFRCCGVAGGALLSVLRQD